MFLIQRRRGTEPPTSGWSKHTRGHSEPAPPAPRRPPAPHGVRQVLPVVHGQHAQLPHPSDAGDTYVRLANQRLRRVRRGSRGTGTTRSAVPVTLRVACSINERIAENSATATLCSSRVGTASCLLNLPAALVWWTPACVGNASVTYRVKYRLRQGYDWKRYANIQANVDQVVWTIESWTIDVWMKKTSS